MSNCKEHEHGAGSPGRFRGPPRLRQPCRTSLVLTIASIVAAAAMPALAMLRAVDSRGAHLTSLAPHEGACPIFPANNPLNQEIAHAPVNPNSAKYIESIGSNIHLHADFGTPPSYGIPYAVVGPHQPKSADPLHRIRRRIQSGPLPDPAERAGGGCGRRRRPPCARAAGGSLQAVRAVRGRTGRHRAGTPGSGAVFNLRSNRLRPEGWTSADAAGLPIFPLLVRYPEVRPGRSTMRCE